MTTVQEIKLGNTFLGPTKEMVASYPDPAISWTYNMKNAEGIEGEVVEIDSSFIKLNFPSIKASWWYTSGALTKGQDQIYFKVTVQGKSIWLTDAALTNLKNELGITF